MIYDYNISNNRISKKLKKQFQDKKQFQSVTGTEKQFQVGTGTVFQLRLPFQPGTGTVFPLQVTFHVGTETEKQFQNSYDSYVTVFP